MAEGTDGIGIVSTRSPFDSICLLKFMLVVYTKLMSKIIQSFEAKELKKRPFIIKIADRLTSFFGSISFLILNLLFFVSWIIFNKFDQFPFPMLTMIVSLEAIFLTIIMLVSQQRQAHIATIREELDMQVNKYSEREITKVLNLLK